MGTSPWHPPQCRDPHGEEVPEPFPSATPFPKCLPRLGRGENTARASAASLGSWCSSWQSFSSLIMALGRMWEEATNTSRIPGICRWALPRRVSAWEVLGLSREENQDLKEKVLLFWARSSLSQFFQWQGVTLPVLQSWCWLQAVSDTGCVSWSRFPEHIPCQVTT